LPRVQAMPLKSAAMELVTAIIRPFKLDEVRGAVTDLGLKGLTVTEVLGFGQHAQREHYRGAEYMCDSSPRTRIEVAAEGAIVEPVVEAIGNVARTDQRGGGKIFVLELTDVIRIRTGEMGAAAI
jgi:nitrogen regulatory protein P-II 2